MRVGGLGIEIHLPLKRKGGGKSLAPLHQWPVYDAADYADACPTDWVDLGAPNRGVFFIGVPRPGEEERELWFDFRSMNHDTHHLAVLMSVQGLNAVSGLPVASGMVCGGYEAPGESRLEQYLENCPVHGVPFQAKRMCPECGFRWPAQNYITNSAGPNSVALFWRDGWRTAEGTISQFVIRPTEEGVGVAQQILGSERSLAIDIAVFRSREPKPAPPPPRPGRIARGKTGGVKRKGYLSGRRIGTSTMRRCAASPSPRRIGAPSQMEIAMDREVSQEVHADPHKLDYWQDQPCGPVHARSHRPGLGQGGDQKRSHHQDAQTRRLRRCQAGQLNTNDRICLGRSFSNSNKKADLLAGSFFIPCISLSSVSLIYTAQVVQAWPPARSAP